MQSVFFPVFKSICLWGVWWFWHLGWIFLHRDTDLCYFVWNSRPMDNLNYITPVLRRHGNRNVLFLMCFCSLVMTFLMSDCLWIDTCSWLYQLQIFLCKKKNNNNIKKKLKKYSYSALVPVPYNSCLLL